MGGGEQSKLRETSSGKIKQQPKACAVPEATGDKLSCPGCEWMEMCCPSSVERKGEDIAVRCQENAGLKAAFAAPAGRFSKAPSGDGGTKVTSLAFYLNLVTMKAKLKKKKRLKCTPGKFALMQLILCVKQPQKFASFSSYREKEKIYSPGSVCSVNGF